MPIVLTPLLEAKIDEMVAAGPYADAVELIDKAVCLLEEQDRRLQWLRAELAIGEEQERRGELVEFTPQRFEEIKRQARENARNGKPIRDAVKP